MAEDLLTKVGEAGTFYGIRILGALLIVLIGRWVAKLLRLLVERLMTQAKAAPILVSFVGSLTYVALMAFVLIAALSQLGVQTASFIAVVGAAGLAVGLALQGSLANFASGVLLITFRPFRVGHFVEAAGVSGVVEDIRMFTTQLRTPDNKAIIIPNAKLTGDNIVNYSVKGTRRVDLVVGVSYDADLDRTRQIIQDVLAKDERILEAPEPQIAICELAESSVNFAVRPWTSADDYWGVYFDTLETLKKRFDEEGIGIPFPQRDIHLHQHSA